MTVTIMIGDVREQVRKLPDESVHCVVTSPPYWGLRDYGVRGQIGLEKSPAEFIAVMVEVFNEVRRVLRSDGVCWINMGDSYAGGGNGAKNYPKSAGAKQLSNHGSTTAGKNGFIPQGLKSKDLCMMPHRLAIALQDAGWWVRQDIVWSKPNPMPESIRDRCTKSHEYIFLLTKSKRYYYDSDAIREQCVSENLPGNNSHKAADAYEDGAAEHRTKSGLVAYSKRQREARGVGFGHGTDAQERGRGRVTARDTFKRENSKRAAVIPGQTVGTHRPDREDTVPNGFRNKRSVWTMATHSFKEAHFATFPPELPETCIKAGSSQHGACSVCGTPWQRDTESTFIPQTDVSEEKGVRGHGDQKPLDASNHRDGFPRGNTNVETIGWSQRCKCADAHIVPCIVLDPFFGAGTTGLIADRLQRDCIGIELNPVYAEMASNRIKRESPMFADVRIVHEAESA